MIMSEKQVEILPLDEVNIKILSMTQNQQNTCTKTVITNLLGVLSIQPQNFLKTENFLRYFLLLF